MEKKSKKNFIKLQLFADGETGGSDVNIEQEPQKTSTETVEQLQAKLEAIEAQRLKDKAIIDKYCAEEKANKEKRKLEMTETERTKLELEELLKQKNDVEAKLLEASIKTNRATAISLTADARAKIGIEAKEFDEILSLVVSENEETTTANATKLSKLLNSVYDNGFKNAKSGEYHSMAYDIKTGETKKGLSIGEKLATQNSQVETNSIKDKYK